ncbi:MAG: hypothetical protein J6B75_01625 [Ruminococcus sp.]|nr:hypothetical protein [Ruminococcus sp.]
MSELSLIATFFGVPIAVLICLIIYVVRYVKTPKDDPELKKKRLLPLIISAAIFLVMILAFAALCVLFMVSLSHM